MFFARKCYVNRVVSIDFVYFIFHAVYMKGKYIERLKTQVEPENYFYLSNILIEFVYFLRRFGTDVVKI